ncbi:6-bladed beta-propeller [Marinilabilia rubra]|uniref:6-bladed beta-propeller n=1 Tax=Marinilabilia rubra TaxID=2162893 RepID=A0A2U2B7H3_9BACT|nr:6-bladed beta-propeller [Marinilabilia rubra]PWD99020.1 hypothetical protein DDZ16_12200 [Marinilabilia rubra]
MKKIFFTTAFIFFLIASCNESNVEKKDIEKIFVDCDDVEGISHNDYFENIELINLETSQKSLIHKINRLYFFKEKIYILDKKQNSIFVFDKTGRFFRKIRNVGRGPGEYIQIGDFTIDEKNNEIIVSMEIPKKVYRYNLSGNFNNSFKVNDCYGAFISIVGNKIVLSGINEKYDYTTHEYNKSTGEFIKSTDKKCKNSYNYPMIRGMYPNMIKSSKSYYNQPLDRYIFSLNDSAKRRRYLIDFGENNLPINIKNKLVDFNILGYCRENNFKTLINSFRDNEDYLFFRYEPASFVLYNKETQHTQVFNHIMDSNTGMNIYNIFPHDGSFNGVVSIMNPINIISRAELIEKNNIEIEDSTLFNLRSKVTESDNPIILRYAFR